MKHYAVALSVLGLVACAGKPNKTEVVNEEPVKTETQVLAEKRGDHVVSTIKFDRGQIQLSDAAKAELQKAVAEARARGDIDGVTVAVWSDVEYPKAQRKLSRGQVKLAEKRGEKIEDYLAEDMDVSSYRVSIHNMGQKPAFLSDYFETADAELKQQLTAMGIAPSGETPVAGSGHASSALVFIKLK